MAGEIYLSNLTGQFDAAAFVDRLMQLKARPLESLAQQKAVVEAKKQAVDELLGVVDTFEASIESLNLDELFQAKTAEISNEEVLGASVTEEAPDLSFDVTVNKLAQKEIRVSTTGVSSLDTTLSASTFTLRFYLDSTNYEDYTINFGGGTLEDLVAQINNAQSRIKASVYYDGSAYRLLLSEVQEGDSTVETDTVAGTYVINIASGALPTELGSLDTNVLQTASNAEIQIGVGSPIYSPTNTFSDVITGVDLTAYTTGSTRVTITEDYSQVSAFLNNFAEKYNEVIDEINKLTDVDTGILLGENFVNSLKSTMADLLEPLISKGIIDYEGDTGKISIRTETLDQLLENEASEVQDALDRIKNTYGQYLAWQTDYLEEISQEYQDQINRLDERARILSEALARERESLLLTYSRIEAFMNEANNIIQRLQDYIVTLSEMYGGE